MSLNENSQPGLSIQTFPLPKNPISELSLKANRIRTKTLKAYQSLSNVISPQTIEPNSTGGKSPTSHNPTSPLQSKSHRSSQLTSQNITKYSSMNGAMRWSRIEPHFGDDLFQEFLPMRSLSILNLNEKIIIYADIEDDLNILISFDANSLCWTVIKQSGDIPPATKANTLTFIGNNKAILFGGGKEAEYYDGLYMLDMNRWHWTKITTEGPSTPARRAHCACFNNGNSSLYVFGGGDGETALNDLWVLNVASEYGFKWELVETENKPPPRGYPTMNCLDEKLLVYGGSNGQTCFGDFHVFDIETKRWKKVFDSEEKKRMGHSALILGNYLIVIGGNDGTQFTKDCFMINLLSYQFEIKRMAPAAIRERGYHSCVLHDSRIFLFGGYNGMEIFSDVWALELASQSFLQRIPAFKVGIAAASVNSLENEQLG